MRPAITLLLLCLAAPAAGALDDPPDLVTLARKHYEAGRALYQLGKYEQALVEFEEGYRIAPRTGFLVNIAQCHRQLGRPRQARAMYEKFLAAAPPDDPMRPGVREILATLGSGEEEPPAVAVAPPPRPPGPAWHRDPAGGVLLAAGAASIVAGVVLLAWSADRLAHAGDTYGDFLAAQAAPGARIAGAVVLGAGALLSAGAAARYGAVHRRGRAPTVAVALGGVAVRF